jgi:flagellar basal-body rod modification protein FlgD
MKKEVIEMGVTVDPTAASGAQQTQQSSTTFSNGQLTSSDFMTLMIQQLVNQDPLNPTDNTQLLTQVSQIQNMNTLTQLNGSISQLNGTMSASALQQKAAMAGALIGKQVTGLLSDGTEASGVVKKVTISATNGVSVNIDDATGDTINIDNIMQIQEAA